MCPILGKMLWNFDFVEADEEGMGGTREIKKTISYRKEQKAKLRFREKEGEVWSKVDFFEKGQSSVIMPGGR